MKIENLTSDIFKLVNLGQIKFKDEKWVTSSTDKESKLITTFANKFKLEPLDVYEKEKKLNKNIISFFKWLANGDNMKNNNLKEENTMMDTTDEPLVPNKKYILKKDNYEQKIITILAVDISGGVRFKVDGKPEKFYLPSNEIIKQNAKFEPLSKSESKIRQLIRKEIKTALKK